MRNVLILIFFILYCTNTLSEPSDKYFHIGKMESYNKKVYSIF